MNIDHATQDYYRSNNERFYTHPVVQAFSKPKYDWISNQVTITGKKVLDVGSGNGYFAQYFGSKSDLTALDLSEHQLKNNPATKKVIGSAYKLPFEDASFDIVFCSNLLHHLESPLIALKEMARVSRKYVIISEPNVFNLIIILGSLFIKHERGALKSSKRFVSNLITEAGLKIIKHTFIGGLVMPNGTPTFMLPYVNPVSRSFCSFFQIFISEKY